MSDLSNLLGDVYGDHHSPDAAPVRRERAADQRAPEWSSSSSLEQAFDGWVPGEPPAASVPAPAPAVVPMPTLAHPVAEAPQAPKAWTSSPEPAPAPARTMVSAPATGGLWAAGDDDIFPSAKGGKKTKRK